MMEPLRLPALDLNSSDNTMSGSILAALNKYVSEGHTELTESSSKCLHSEGSNRMNRNGNRQDIGLVRELYNSNTSDTVY